MWPPKLEFDEPSEELTPGQMHDRWEGMTNMQADDLRRLEESERYGLYLEDSGPDSGVERDDPPIPGGPLDDAIHLATTPRDEWGADEKEEAIEAENFLKRTVPQFDQDEGEALLPDEPPRIHRGEIALMRWASDPDKDDGWP